MSDKILKLSQAQTLYEDLRERVDALPTSDDIPEVPVQDVQVNGTSILENGVANIPKGYVNQLGVVKCDNSYGIGITESGIVRTITAPANIVKAGTDNTLPIASNRTKEAIYYGLAKAAGADMKNVTDETVGVYPDAQKAAIQNMLGITDLISTEESSTATAAHALNSTFMMNGKLHRATAAIAIGDAVEVGTNCEVVKVDEVFVKKTDYASSSSYGIIKVGSNSGLLLDNGVLSIQCAGSTYIKVGANNRYCITPLYQHESVYYGLSKLAGVDLANETVTFGTYPEASKTAIRSLIGAGTYIKPSSGIPANDIAKGPGIIAGTGDILCADFASSTNIINKTNYKILHTGLLHTAVFYGLAYAAGDTTQATGTPGVYTTEAKTAIRNMIGAGTPLDVQINGTSIVNSGIANIPVASSDNLGIVCVNNASGVAISSSNNRLFINKATDAEIKAGSTDYKPIVASNQHLSTFYGLAKAAGDNTQSASDNAIGTYTNEAKAAIKSMIGVNVEDVQVNGTSIVTNGVANVPIAVADNGGYGVVKVSGYGLTIRSGTIGTAPATNADVKDGQHLYRPIVPSTEHLSTFYGLAKAAGDITQSASDNTVGTYTDEAKAAIHTMLGIDPASIAAQVDIPLVETVSGTTPTITGQPNVRYVCSEVSTISITPPASGSVDVIFESGSTATTMTVPSTVKWPAWFDAETLEANTTYEVLITDGIYGSVMTWAT